MSALLITLRSRAWFCMHHLPASENMAVMFTNLGTYKWVSLLHLMLGVFVTAVKYRPLLHYCVVILVWSSDIMDCICLHLKNKLWRSCARGASVVCHLSKPLMNSFNKTESCMFPCTQGYHRQFPFFTLIAAWPCQSCCIERTVNIKRTYLV